MMKIATNSTLRINGIIVCARVLARPLRERVSARCTAVSLRIQISQAKISVPARLNSEGDQRHAPDPQAELDERQPHQQVSEGVEEVFQAFRVQRMALHTALRFKRMTADQSVDDHAQHQQHGADQRLSQGSAGVAG
jgi:hypothetical protein